MSTERPPRIHKYLADQGCGSRREIERWIEAGRITVDGIPATLGQLVTAQQKIQIDGRDITPRAAADRRVLLYHKPLGELCTRRDPGGRATVFDHLPKIKGGRWIGVGRLDVNSSGLLLLTTDGELAAYLMHPRNQIEREYLCRVRGEVEPQTLKRLQSGIRSQGETLAFTRIQKRGGEGQNRWYAVVVRQGRNREVRRLWQAAGHPVSRLIRIRYGPVELPKDLAAGEFVDLPGRVIRRLAPPRG